MKERLILIVLGVVLIASGCYRSITGRVVDAETGEPIEGAVVLVEWTITKGLPGMSYTESYKVVEVVTDKDGKFKIPGVFNPFVDPPDVTIYKKGYVAWNSRIIFPDYKKRTDFKWKDGYVFKLVKFKPEYSHNDHVSFIYSAIKSGLGKKIKIKRVIEWEEKKAFEERKKLWRNKEE